MSPEKERESKIDHLNSLKDDLESQIKEINVRTNLRNILSIDEIMSREQLDHSLQNINKQLDYYNSPIYFKK